jgi:hypothetical protein
MTDRRSTARGGAAGRAVRERPVDVPERVAAWPEIAASSRLVWPLMLWRATSEHPELGVVRGRGLSHASAMRSVARQVQRRTAGIERPA